MHLIIHIKSCMNALINNRINVVIIIKGYFIAYPFHTYRFTRSLCMQFSSDPLYFIWCVMHFEIKEYTLSLLYTLKVSNDLFFNLSRKYLWKINVINKSLKICIFCYWREKKKENERRCTREISGSCGVSVKRAGVCDCAMDEREVPRGSDHHAEASC